MDTPQPNEQIYTQIGDNASGIAVGKQITQNFYNQPAPPTDITLDFAAVEQRHSSAKAHAQAIGIQLLGWTLRNPHDRDGK